MAPMIFRYYWNQSIFFNLNQGTNLVNKPTIHQIVLIEIERYKTRYGPQPKVFSKVQNKINIDTRKIVYELKRYVWEKFDKKEKFYKRNNSESYIELYIQN